MLDPNSRTWTLRRRRLIVAGIIGAVGAFAILVSIYEAHYRGPDERMLFGTWQCIENCVGKPYTPFAEGDYCLRPDHSFEVLSHGSGYIADGRWYAGGSFIYFRLRGRWFVDIPVREIFVWRIKDIGPTELRVELWTDKPPRVYRRLNSFAPNASNHALQPTPPPVSLLFFMSYPRVMKPRPQRRG